jgi:hypothetical protein
MNVSHRIPHLLAITILTAATLAASAQSASPRIRGPIEPIPSVTLPGSLNPHIRDAEDLGPLPPDITIPGITLVLSRSPQQQAALDQLLAEQTNPASPLFHQWLTPDQFAARFGPAPSDVASTEQWLQDRGFSLDPTARISGRISFSGTASQVHQAFGAELHRFRTNNEFHFAPATELSLPPALAPVTAAVLHLSDFRPKPNIRPRPSYTTLSTQSHFLSANDVRTMYDYWPLNGHSYGAFQPLAIVGQSYVPTGPDSQVVRFGAGLGTTPVLVPGSGVEAIFPGDEGESEIDIEYGSSVGVGGVYFVFTGASPNYDVIDALVFAITHDIAPVISISYSECEPLIPSAQIQQYNALFQQAAAQGQTIVAAAGDQGPTACAEYGSSSGVTTAQQQGLAVNFPASSPFVTAVGGTQMAPGTFSAGSSPYWNPATTIDLTGSLIGYTSEVVWNEDSSTGIFSSTGGGSIFFSRPSWQIGVPGIPSGTSRLVPDVAFQASAANPGYVICTDDPSIGGDSSDCAGTNLRNSSGQYILNGGTSFSAPIFAGFIAFLNGYEQSNGQGNINPVLYSLAAQPAIYASAFHDITAGTTACPSGETNCSIPGQSGFAATVGYDQATGLGSIDFAKLIAAWPVSPSKGLTPTIIFATGVAPSAKPGDPLKLSIQVYGPYGTNVVPAPTGSVSVLLDGATPISISLSPLDMATVTANYTFNAPSTTGSHIVSLLYPGDSIHSGSANTVSFMVGSPVATGSVTLSANNVSLSANSAGSTQITVTPSGGYNGALTWSAGYTGGTVSQTICYLVASPPVISATTTAAMQIGVGTACNSPLHAYRAQSSDVQRAALDQPFPHTAPRLRRHVAETPVTPILALLFFGLLPHRRRKPLPVLTALLLFMLPIALSGCGGASSSAGSTASGGTSTQPQVYTITITAKDSVQTSITASTTFTLTVN